MYVCVFVHKDIPDSQELHIQTSLNFLYRLPVAATRSCSEGIVITRVLPVLSMLSSLHIMAVNMQKDTFSN